MFSFGLNPWTNAQRFSFQCLAFLKFIEASAELQSKIGRSESVEEEVFGEGDLVTSRSKGTVYGKNDSVIFTEK